MFRGRHEHPIASYVRKQKDERTTTFPLPIGCGAPCNRQAHREWTCARARAGISQTCRSELLTPPPGDRGLEAQVLYSPPAKRKSSSKEASFSQVTAILLVFGADVFKKIAVG